MDKIEEKNKKKGSGTLGTIITFAVCIGAIVAIILTAVRAIKGKLVSFFGYSFSVVGSGSMSPTIEVGDALIIRKVDFESIKENDIIVYYNNELKINVVHRVIDIDESGALITQGDNKKTNPVPDTIHTTKDNFIGIVVKYGNVLGAGSVLLNNKSMIFVIIVIVFVVFIALEVANFIKAIREKEIDELKAKVSENRRIASEFNYEEEKAKLREELIKELGINKEDKK